MWCTRKHIMAQPRTFTFLIAPIEAVGHFNACIGIGQKLQEHGHRIVFATPNSWTGKLKPLGFTEEYYQPPCELDESPEKWGSLAAAMAPALALPPNQKMELLHHAIYVELIKTVKETDEALRALMARVKPDLILVDNIVHTPALTNQGVPWILSASLTPIGISSKNVPPAMTGYPTNSDSSMLAEYNEKYEEVIRSLFEEFNDWLAENGGPELKQMEYPFWIEYSPYANIYMYLSSFRPNPPNWHQFDCFVRHDPQSFEVPKELENLPKKLVYVSMGSIGCAELGIMRKLVSILANSPHRFIFSKGPLGDQFELAPNMWGAARVPQTNVLPLVDLVITLGGNNTVAESCYFGRRMIVLPLFGDQLDNGQRIEATGLGLQFQPYSVTKDELLAGVEMLLSDDLLQRRMLSRRMQVSKSQERASELVERVAVEFHSKIQPSIQSRPGSRRSSVTPTPRRQSQSLQLPDVMSLWARRKSMTNL